MGSEPMTDERLKILRSCFPAKDGAWQEMVSEIDRLRAENAALEYRLGQSDMENRELRERNAAGRDEYQAIWHRDKNRLLEALERIATLEAAMLKLDKTARQNHLLAMKHIEREKELVERIATLEAALHKAF